AVAVAFANGGMGDALIVLAIITAVQQLEGDIVLPIVFGQTLRLHPLLILLGIAAGGIAFGIVGAFLSVPLIAVALAIREELAAEPDETMAPIARGDVVGDEG
ncbi:MAG: AI-2E family transporter, partial [Gammaproteobacteria bacterium]|nr:AI-2E family transporter [Gemmatimonadota bacterium]NIR35456.1 AI-2E family transporter [Actinomycetota bacterium]NIU73145.1 AI-2E family transporter [Gammaproteobacteria bacterium]NIX21074.1 AI-2E family transporter [Actinomycetota bacterium]